MAHRLSAVAIALTCLSSAGAAHATDPKHVVWSKDWPKFRLSEGIATLAMGAGIIAIESVPAPTNPTWRGGILFDDSVRSSLRGGSASTEKTAVDVGDVLFYGGVVTPFIIDIYVVALGVHQNAEVAGEMLMMNLQSLGVSGVLSLGAEHIAARERPFNSNCPASGPATASGQSLLGSCDDSSRAQSFYSGHSAAVMTMAGLTCAHHQHLPLYGGGVADLAPCVVMVGAALGTGVARIVGDRHWASDVVLGWTVGALSGYVLPSLLHYGFTNGHPLGEVAVGGLRMAPVPQAYVGGGGLGMVGYF